MHSHVDRIISGTAVPVIQVLKLTAGAELRADYFLQRRELGIINIGGKGRVIIDGKTYEVDNKEGMYVGMGAQDIQFTSEDSKNPAKFYLNSAPAHKAYPTVLIKKEGKAEEGVTIIKEVNKVELGSLEESNHRVIFKYILFMLYFATDPDSK